MGQPAAKLGDRVTGTDTHLVMVPAPPGPPVATPLPHPFVATITGAVSSDVMIMGRPAATVGSTATANPPHLPIAPGTAFQRPPTNRATVLRGSTGVTINGRPAARSGDPALTCNDPADLPVGTVLAEGTVLIG